MPTKQFSWLALILLALPLLAILLASGCTTPVTGGGKGVTIAGFEPELPEVYAGESVNFRLLVKNEGSVEAKNVYAEVLGIDEDWCPYMGGKCEPSPNLGSPEKLPDQDECQYTKTGFSLLAPNQQMGTSGSQHICTWSYKAPPIPKDFTMTYNPTARVFFSYSSYVSKLITFGSSREMRNLQDKGGSLVAGTKSQTNGPITVDIVTQGPIRYSEAEKQVTFPLEITISNGGGGLACAYSQEKEMKYACKATKSSEGELSKNKVRIKIWFGDSKATTSSDMKLSDDCNEFLTGKTISLWQFKSNSFICYLTANNLDSIAPTQRIINVEAEYEYYIEQETTIKVIGRDIPKNI